MKKLPEVYKQDIIKKITNNDTVYYCKTNSNILKDERINIKEFINNLFKERGYIFNKGLIIKTNDKVYDTAIIKKINNSILTLSEDLIDIDSIISIERK